MIWRRRRRQRRTGLIRRSSIFCSNPCWVRTPGHRRKAAYLPNSSLKQGGEDRGHPAPETPDIGGRSALRISIEAPLRLSSKRSCAVGEILLKDAFQFLKDLPEDSVDLIISSPPYFMGKEYDSSRDISKFIETHEKLLKHVVRVIRWGGGICWQIGHHVDKNVIVPLDALVYTVFSKSDCLYLRNRIVWTFGHGAHCSHRFSGRHESILWFSKGDDYSFNLDAVRVPQKYPGKRHYKGPNRGKLSGNPLGKNPGDVWDVPNVKARHPEKTEHPCQFPVALAQRLIRALTRPGALVVDPYLGSGSTAIAATLERRRFMGCDHNEKYIEIARNRLRELAAGNLKVRSLDLPVQPPKPTQSVARFPSEWADRARNGVEYD